MKYTEGEHVLARHPISLEYYKGTVINVRGDRYKIKFDTGGEYVINENYIQFQRISRSTTRTSRPPGKSPSRHSPSRKSPSKQSPSKRSPSRRSPSRRSPSRRSPSRRSPNRRSPSRRSPSRRSPDKSVTPTSSRKLPIRSTRFAKISLSRIDYDENNHKEDISKVEEKSIETIPLQQRLNEINTDSVQRYRGTQLSNVKTEQEYKIGQFAKSFDRAVSVPLERKTYVHDYLPDEKERGYSMQRDQDLKTPFSSRESEKDDKVTLREEDISKIDKPQEWGGWIGTSLFVLILPLSLILPQLLCSGKQCEFANIKFSPDFKSYINLHGLLSYALFLTLLACISFVPIGRIVDGPQSKIGRLQYRINGLLTVLVAVVTFGLSMYKDIRVDDYILNNIMQLSVSGWILGTILALGLYVKAERTTIANLNIYASTNSKMYNFWQGREINPRIGALDIKLLLIRASSIGTLLVNMAIVAKVIYDMESLNIKQLDGSLVLIAILQWWYIIDGLINEATILTSFEIMYEGTGYMMCVYRLLYPFLMTLTTRFVLHQKIRFNYFAGIFVLSFMLGYILYRISNSRKNDFRKNLVTSASYFDTISTSRGKKLVLSGLWGHVRHPNYLGDIIMHWSIAGISLAGDILPYYAAIWFTLMLAYRAVRDNRRCQARYGDAWQQYCSRVKYIILKYVF